MLSIIIPVFNQHAMTEECLEAVKTHTKDYELVIVDNGSDPPIEGASIRNETNLGFPVAVNQGIRVAKGEVIIVLNNDVMVTPGWASRILYHLNSFSVIGPVTNYCVGKQKISIPTYLNKEELNKEATALAEEFKRKVEEVNWIIGFCFAFKKSLWEEIGPLDESIWPCSGEEIDFCFRAKAAGHRVGIARDVFVHHDGSITFLAMGIDYAKLCHQNDTHLGEKWGKDFWERQAYIAPDRYDVAPDGAIRLNLGCGYAPIPNFVNIDNRPEVNPDVVCDISKGLPYPDNSVDEIRAFDFIEHLERHEVLALMDEIYRVLKPHGRFWHQTPSDDGRGAWQDPHHKSCWNINTWRYYFSDPDMRKLYGTVANFKVIEIRDEWTDKENRVLHTDCTYEAIKEESCTKIQSSP